VGDKAASGKCRTFPFFHRLCLSYKFLCRSRTRLGNIHLLYLLHFTLSYVCYITFWGIRDTFDQETTTTSAYSQATRPTVTVVYAAPATDFPPADSLPLPADGFLGLGCFSSSDESSRERSMILRLTTYLVGLARASSARCTQGLGHSTEANRTLTRPRMVILTRR
jgi:hypothetical protein